MPGLLPPFHVADSTFVSNIYYSKKPSAMISTTYPFPAQFRLRSPPPIQERCIPLPCTPTPRRRARVSLLSQRRRRQQQQHASRVDYRPELPQLHPFDKLPWIASLDEPLSDNVHPADLADLSLLPHPTLPRALPFRPGPVRRQRQSPRSSPLLPSSTPTRVCAGAYNDDDDDHLFQLNNNLFPRDAPSRPSTPAARIDLDPSRVSFRHLMPVVSLRNDDGVDDDL